MMIFAEIIEINDILSLIVTILTLISVIAALIPTAIKLINAIKKLLKEKNWKIILEFAKEAITIAEASGKSGEEKKQFVICHVQEACKKVGIEIDEACLNDLGNSIDDLVSWFNKMKEANTSSKS